MTHRTELPSEPVALSFLSQIAQDNCCTTKTNGANLRIFPVSVCFFPSPSMAPSLTSNSFIGTSAAPSRINPWSRRPTIFAKRANPFSPFSKPSEAQGTGNSSSFRFDFGKLPDLKSLVPVVANPSTGLSYGGQRRKDPGTVFVAGATGQAGIRIAQTLLRQGFSVRAGVPDLAAAQELSRLAATYKIISNEESRRLNAVDSTFEDAELIAKAIGNASKVVVTIGPAENGPSAQVTTSDALQVVQAAQLANADHVAIVYDVSSTITSTNKVLDGISSFFNNLFSRSQSLTMVEFLQRLVEADISYTLIKTKLTEDFSPESSYNLVVSAEGGASASHCKVAKSQIASLVAELFSNTTVTENKVVEVFTDPSAPSMPVDELFRAIPEDGRRKVYAESFARAKAEEEAREASEIALEAAEAAKKLEAELKKLEEKEAEAASVAAEAQKKAAAAGASVESLLTKAKGFTPGFYWENLLSSKLQSVVEKPSEEPKVEVATLRGQAKARSLPSLKAVVKNPSPSRLKDILETTTKSKQSESTKETRNVFGGLFKQETIYIDED